MPLFEAHDREVRGMEEAGYAAGAANLRRGPEA